MFSLSRRFPVAFPIGCADRVEILVSVTAATCVRGVVVSTFTAALEELFGRLLGGLLGLRWILFLRSCTPVPDSTLPQ